MRDICPQPIGNRRLWIEGPPPSTVRFLVSRLGRRLVALGMATDSKSSTRSKPDEVTCVPADLKRWE